MSATKLTGSPVQIVTIYTLTAQLATHTVSNMDMQGKFKHATGSVMAQGNARNYALGVEGVSYEGPLRVRLPVKKELDADGSFSFEIPLPNPDRQVLLKRFAGGFKQALSSPLSVQQVATQIATQTISSPASTGSGVGVLLLWACSVCCQCKAAVDDLQTVL